MKVSVRFKATFSSMSMTLISLTYTSCRPKNIRVWMKKKEKFEIDKINVQKKWISLSEWGKFLLCTSFSVWISLMTKFSCTLKKTYSLGQIKGWSWPEVKQTNLTGACYFINKVILVVIVIQSCRCTTTTLGTPTFWSLLTGSGCSGVALCYKDSK